MIVIDVNMLFLPSSTSQVEGLGMPNPRGQKCCCGTVHSLAGIIIMEVESHLSLEERGHFPLP